MPADPATTLNERLAANSSGQPDGDRTHPRTLGARFVSCEAKTPLGPRPVRARQLWRRYLALAGAALPCARWLQPEALRRMPFVAARQFGGRPNCSEAAPRWRFRERSIIAHRHNMGLTAADYSVRHVDPILDPGFVTALASSRGGSAFRAGRRR